MKKLSILLGVCVLLLCIVAIIKIRQPSQKEIEHYQALLCFIVRKPAPPQDEAHFMQEMEKYQQGSISDYAVQHPDFREELARDWIRRYNSLSTEQKQQARQDYQPCIDALKKTTTQ